MKKRILSVVLSVVLSLGLFSCGRDDSSKYYGDYYDGYVDGYNDGIASTQEYISDRVLDRFNDIDVCDAMQTLSNYADGEPISEEELRDAIWLVYAFYHDAWDVVWDIDDYDID